MNKFKLIAMFLCLMLCSERGFGQQNDKMLQFLKKELDYHLQELKKQELPPYYMNFRVVEENNVTVQTSFGALMGAREQKSCQFIPQIRVGSPELDNFKNNPMGTFKDRSGNYPAAFFPTGANPTEETMRQAIWAEVLKRYEFATQTYRATMTQKSVSVEDEDKAPYFSDAPVEKYYEAPISAKEQKVDMAAWEKRLKEVSAVFKSSPLLLSGDASLSYKVQRTYFVDDKGAEVVQNRTYARVVVTARMKAADGMDLPLNLSYFAYDPDDLPATDKMIADAQDMVRRLLALRDAPVANPYTGPALLSGPASGVFFHEIFGHRVEGHRMKSGGQTFKKMVGEQVLPLDFQVYCDPTLRQYAGEDLNGSYLYDDQGVKARRVDVVKNGILREFLMSRVALDGFPQSNGHGRTAGPADPVSRQSNLIIESSQPKSDAELRALLVEETKKQGLEYGYYFKEVTSGFTYTGEGGSLNSFSVTPLEVYRVYADGRPDELVRGVDLIGTPLSMFSNIVAGGDTPSVFTGMCGAESGWVPVTASSPMIMVNKIETQRRQKSQDIPPILQAPAVTGKEDVSDEAIFATMGEELNRTMNELQLPGMSKPFHAAYGLGRFRQFEVVGVLGSIVNTMETPLQSVGSVQMLLGDHNRTSDGSYANPMGQVAMPADADADAMRRTYWQASDMMYKHALGSMVAKESYLQNNPQTSEDAQLPDLNKVAAVREIVEAEAPYNIDLPALENLVRDLSAIFKEYTDIDHSVVILNGFDTEIYKRTSEGVLLKVPQRYVNLSVQAALKTADGERISDAYTVLVDCPDRLPASEVLNKNVRSFISNLLSLSKAEKMAEDYNGPVLFENGACSSMFIANLLNKDGLFAFRTLDATAKNPQALSERMGKRVLDERVTVKNLTALKEYNGVSLLGAYAIDAEGVKPAAELTLVEEGVLKNLLNGNIPAPKAPQSTGSSRFVLAPNNLTYTTAPGTIHISVSDGLKQDKMKKALIKAAKEEGLEYAYIVRRVAGTASLIYRVNVKDGSETQVRFASVSGLEQSDLEEVMEISAEENTFNYVLNGQVLSSMICPKAILLEDIDIRRMPVRAEKKSVIENPLKRNR